MRDVSDIKRGVNCVATAKTAALPCGVAATVQPADSTRTVTARERGEGEKKVRVSHPVGGACLLHLAQQ